MDLNIRKMTNHPPSPVLASRADQRVLRWFGHVERMDDYRMARRVLKAEVSGGRVRERASRRETEVKLEGWFEGGLRQQRNDGGGCASMLGKSGEPWYIRNWMSFTRPFLLGTVFFRTAPPCSGGYHLERGGMPLHDAVGINCKQGATTENQGAVVKYMG